MSKSFYLPEKKPRLTVCQPCQLIEITPSSPPPAFWRAIKTKYFEGLGI